MGIDLFIAFACLAVTMILSQWRSTVATSKRMDQLSQNLQSDNNAFRREMREEMNTFRSEMREDINTFRSEMHKDMGALRSEMRKDMGALRSEMRKDMGALRSEMREDMRGVRGDVNRLDSRVAHQGGLLQGLWSSVFGDSRTSETVLSGMKLPEGNPA